MNLEADFDLQIGDNNTIEINFTELELTGFNVTIDHCGVSSDEHNIQTRLNGIMAAIKASINSFVAALKPTLPKF